MRLAPRGAELISSYWKEFEEISRYKVVLSGEKIPTCITTKNGEKSVAAIYRRKNSNGAMILLPDIDFYDDEFLEEKDGKKVWTKAAEIFSSKLVKAVVSLDKALKTEGESTPEPGWAKEKEYQLSKESEVRSVIPGLLIYKGF